VRLKGSQEANAMRCQPDLAIVPNQSINLGKKVSLYRGVDMKLWLIN